MPCCRLLLLLLLPLTPRDACFRTIVVRGHRTKRFLPPPPPPTIHQKLPLQNRTLAQLPDAPTLSRKDACEGGTAWPHNTMHRPLTVFKPRAPLSPFQGYRTADACTLLAAFSPTMRRRPPPPKSPHHTWRRSRWACCQSGSLARREGVGSMPCVSMLASSTTYSPRRSQTCGVRGGSRFELGEVCWSWGDGGWADRNRRTTN